MTFEPGTAVAPMAISIPRNDPASWPIPEAASEKLIALRQRVRDLFVAVPEFDSVMDLTNAKLGYERRILELTKPRGAGGYNLKPSDPQVQDEQRRLDKVIAERTRLERLREKRSDRASTAGQLERAITHWLGSLTRCTLEVVGDAPPAKLLLKGETAIAAVERYRGKLSDLTGKLNQVRNAPWPSALAIQVATEQIRAMATPPDCAGVINRMQPISFAVSATSSMVHTPDKPSLVFGETPNSLGLIAYLFEKELVAKVTADIKRLARDDEALDEVQRRTQEQALLEQIEDAERCECSLIWNAEARGEIIDFRVGTSPAVLLGVRSIIATSRQ